MTDPQRILFAGDTHGNLEHCEWVAEYALSVKADAIVQVGDLGAWEHRATGRQFLDDLAALARHRYMPWIFVDGNHDNVAFLRHYRVDPDGFAIVRAGIRYAPRGHRWNWSGTRFIALGGAYSIDKAWRLKREAILGRTYGRNMAGELWFPEEQMTDADMTAILSKATETVDIIVSHDKPRAASPAPDWRDIPECLPNQDRLQRAVTALEPRLLVHGHLHRRYTDTIRCSGEQWTWVEGLGADVPEHGIPWRADDSVLLVTLPLDES